MENLFVEGAISIERIAGTVQKHCSEAEAGGQSIFLGRVRADEKENKAVQAIEFTAHRELAIKKMMQLRKEIVTKYELSDLQVYHSLGTVKTGEICLFVFTSSKHRKPAMEACNELVERLKKELPVWGKEIYSDGSYHWKENIPLAP